MKIKEHISEINSNKKKLYALTDTAASLCVLKQDLIDPKKFTETRVEQVYTAAGEITTKVYKGKVKLDEMSY